MPLYIYIYSLGMQTPGPHLLSFHACRWREAVVNITRRHQKYMRD